RPRHRRDVAPALPVHAEQPPPERQHDARQPDRRQPERGRPPRARVHEPALRGRQQRPCLDPAGRDADAMTGLRRLTAAAIAAVFVAGAHAAGDELQPAVSPPATANVVPSPAVAATTGARPLRVLAADASAIVLADVRRTELYDEGRLHLYRMHVERVLRGRLDDADPGIAEVRGDSKRPPLAIDGEHVVVFLRPAWGQTYLTEHLPAGTYYTVVGARDGVVPVASEAQREAVERAIADGAAIATLDAPAAPAARRRLAFTELASTSPRLAGDALAELRGFATLSPLAPEELAALSRALRDVTVDPVVRVGLIELVADRHAGDA